MNTEATHDQNEALTTGARLRNAREQLGLSQQAVAERLCLKAVSYTHLDVYKRQDLDWQTGRHARCWSVWFCQRRTIVESGQ